MAPSPKAAPRVFAFLESRQLGMAWVIAVILGGVVISINPSVNPPRLIIPVAIMLGYGAFVYNRWVDLFSASSQAYQLSIIAQLADSMYFMGFVWTLWALIDSFVIHQSQINTGDAIFRTFGYALVTTASGMFCRLAILQFKYTATEQSNEAQASVEELLLKFGSTLEGTQRVLEQWHITLSAGTTAIGAANQGLMSTVERAREELTTTMAKATGEYCSMLATTQVRLQHLLEETHKNVTVALREGVADGLKDFGRETAANLEQVRDATSGLVTTLKRTNTGLGKSVTDLAATLDETAQALGASVSTASTAAQQVASAASNVTHTLDVTSESVAAATQSMTRSMGGLAEQIKRELTLGLEGITITPHVAVTVDEGVLNTAITPVRDGLHHLGEQANGIQKTLDAKLPELGPLVESVLQRVDRTVQTAVATITGRLERLDAEVHSLQTQNRGLFGHWFGR